MAEPLLAVLLLRQLGFPPWQYGLAFAAPASAGSSAHAWPAASWGTTAGHEHTPSERLARTLSAWSIGSGAAIAIFNALADCSPTPPAHAPLSRSRGCSFSPARCRCPGAGTLR